MGQGMLKCSHATTTQLLMFIYMKMCWFVTSVKNGGVGIVKGQMKGKIWKSLY